MDEELDHKARDRVISAAFISALCILFSAGLWPFHVPQNDVTWVTNGEGLRFGHYGAIISAGSFVPQPDKASGGIELWLEPSFTSGTHTILSFDGSAHSGVPFSLRQDNDALIVVQDNEDIHGVSWTAWSVVRGVFHARNPALATIILGSRHTSVYVDGVLKENFVIGDSRNNFTGRLVLANSPDTSNSWPGIIRGMAIYNRELTQKEVLEHYRHWSSNNRSNLLDGETPIALYLFNEHAGDTVYNEIDHRTDLKVPTRYFVLHPAFLKSPWQAYHPNLDYWTDFAINVAGFIPFGLLSTMYFSSVHRLPKAVVVSILLGLFVSLLIEILQAFLPTRDSGISDLITNTLGTTLGAMMYLWLGHTTWLTGQFKASGSIEHMPTLKRL